MKNTFTLMLALGATSFANAQECDLVISKDSLTVRDANNAITSKVSSAYKYNETTGLPTAKIIYDATTNLPTTKEVYYYSPTSEERLDSIVGFDYVGDVKTGYKKTFEFDANGNWTKQTITQVGGAQEVTTFSYNGNVLVGIVSPDYNVSNIVFNGAGNIQSASIVFSGLTTSVNFSFDVNRVNIFKDVLGINEDIFSYFVNNDLTSAVVAGTSILDYDYVYDAQGLLTKLTRVERTGIATTSITTFETAYTYDCVDRLTSVRDAKMTQSHNVSPNPSADGIFNINEDMESVIVRNAEGQLVLSSDQNRLDLSTQKSGFYFLEIKSSKGVKFAKVIKQ